MKTINLLAVLIVTVIMSVSAITVSGKASEAKCCGSGNECCSGGNNCCK